ncbi:heat shock cognate protein, putative [Trichomonas vaginalis G3]|uniref:Heat shock cognate protein, putative n=2 Tax=Trichomonas vaginalis TaxID=5722 RepID=A2E1T4_TRIV3|nr:ATP binding [Trichomonas vaginalis G3]EAY13413.1 heat shock cognate protein, putative [Trichomonas vaginalis G3]KAI5528179.1 ATP binding [Trichomonas vaginalis G3]|eukprot:XP_001325636.1 heat shock cognate protein [Trichomonas vaginalis G3]
MFAFLFCSRVSCEQKHPIIGIDLGTTFSCVGVFMNGKVDIIPNEVGNRITPSVVYIGNGKKIVGDAAMPYLVSEPKNTIYAIKRLIGRRFSDPEVQNEIPHLGYKVIDKNNHPYVEINNNGVIEHYSPEEISSMILYKMKSVAESYLGYQINESVVTVPAYFNDNQRKSTFDAGKIIGLKITRIINEPTAASLAYGLDRKNQDSVNILVYDLGGGTFDISLLTVEDSFFEVLATSGDTHLGGEDFDIRLVEHFADVFQRKTGKNPRNNPRSMAILKRECEHAKRVLTFEHQTQIEIENFYEGLSFSEPLTRARFEELNMDLFRKTIQPITQVLDDANLMKHEIDEIVLVGGSTRIIKIQQLVREYFNGKSLCKSINPDEAVANGAAVEGAILNNEVDILLHNINPLTLGIETVGGLMSEVIPRNTRIPVTKTRTFSNAEDDDDTVTIQIYEGERPLTRDNHFLGSFDLSGLPPGPRGTVLFEVSFELDQNNILTVSAKDISSGHEESITISANDNRLDSDEMENAIENAQQWEEDDEKLRSQIVAKNKFETAIARAFLKLGETDLPEEKREHLEKRLNEEKEYLKDTEDDAEQILERFDKLGEEVSFLFTEKDEKEMNTDEI